MNNYDTLIRIVRDDNNEFKIGLNQTWQLLKSGLDGFGDIENTITFIDNATMDGGTFSGMHIGKVDRTIKCACTDIANNSIHRGKAMEFFKPKSSYKIYVTYGGRTRLSEGLLYKFKLPNDNINELQKMTLTFLFATPYWKSVDDFGKDVAYITPMFAFPWLINGTGGKNGKGVTTGIFNFSEIVNISNTGDIDTTCKAIIKATGNVSNPKLIINDEYVRVIDEMVKDDKIEIDFTKLPPTVVKNGENYIGHCDRTSAFDSMQLKVGDNQLQYTADDGSDNLSVSIYFSKLYGEI